MVRIMETLGAYLVSVRKERGRSLKSVADEAGISTTYLRKLEQGEVRSPSPHILRATSSVLKISYRELMDLAGYGVPEPPHQTRP